MDQSASVISLHHTALYISFFPTLTAIPIPLPTTTPRAVLVCANSLVVSDKVVHAKSRYNLRVVETLVAARVLARCLGVSVGPVEKVTLREVIGRWAGEGDSVGVGEGKEESWLKDALEKVVYELDGLKLVGGDGSSGEEVGVTMEEMIRMSGLERELFERVYLSWVNGSYVSICIPSISYSSYSPILKHSRSNPLPTLQTHKTRFHRSPPSSPIPRHLRPR